MICKVIDLFPVSNRKAVFDEFGGNGYGCNPKYFAEVLQCACPELDLVWICKDIKEVKVPKGVWAV